MLSTWLQDCGEDPEASYRVGGGGVVFQFLHREKNKERIAAWSLDLFRLLHVFRVRPIVSV